MIDLRSLALALALVLVAPGCDRPRDLPQKHDEVLARGRAYQDRFDDLKERADELDRRLRAMPPATPNIAATQHTLALARTQVDQSRARLARLPAALGSGIKTGNAREVDDLLAGLRRQLDRNATEATSEIDAVESWTALVEHGLTAPQAPPAATPDPMPEPRQPGSEPANEPANDDGAATTGPAAPDR